MSNDFLPTGTYHVLVHFIRKSGSCGLLRVTLLPTGIAHEFVIWPSQFNKLIESLVGQHHPDTGIANAQLLLDVEWRLREKDKHPYNLIKAFHRPATIVPMVSDVRPPPPPPEPVEF